MKKGIVWYTGNRVDPLLTMAVQNQLRRSGLPIVSVSLQPIPFGDQNVVLSLEYGIPTMFKQILAGIEASDADVIFLCEDDMIYHQSHFEFTPGEDTFWYNENDWKTWSFDMLHPCENQWAHVSFEGEILRVFDRLQDAVKEFSRWDKSMVCIYPVKIVPRKMSEYERNKMGELLNSNKEIT